MNASCEQRRPPAAFLGGNSRRGDFILDAGMLQVGGRVSRERRWGSDGASLKYVSDFSVDPIGFNAGDANLYRYCNNSPANYVDPSGLDWLDTLANWAAGWGDTISFGATDAVRNAAGINGGIDHSSTAYNVGVATGIANDIAWGAAGGLRAAGAKGIGKEFSHWVPNRMGGARSLWNGNYVSREVHALSDPYRYRFMSKAWKAAHPLPGAASRQLTRIPNVYKGMGAGAAVGGLGAAANAARDQQGDDDGEDCCERGCGEK